MQGAPCSLGAVGSYNHRFLRRAGHATMGAEPAFASRHRGFRAWLPSGGNLNREEIVGWRR